MLFSIRTLINTRLEVYMRRWDLVQVDSYGFPNEGYGLAEQLFRVSGVQSIWLDQYDIHIKIAHAFAWEEIIPEVTSKILSYLKSQQVVEEFGH